MAPILRPALGATPLSPPAKKVKPSSNPSSQRFSKTSKTSARSLSRRPNDFDLALRGSAFSAPPRYLFSLELLAIVVCQQHHHSVMFTSDAEPRFLMTNLPDASLAPSAFDTHHPPSKQIIENCVH